MSNSDLINTVVFLRHRDVECWNFHAAHAQRLQRHLPAHQMLICENEQAFVAALPEADCALVWRFRQEWFESAPRLRVLSTPSAGRDYFQVSPPPYVRMMYGAFHGNIIAETVVGMMLAMSRGLLAAVTTLADKPWPRRELSAMMRPLRGSQVVILGFGHIGEWIGRLLKPFGAKISGMRRSLSRPAPDWFTAEDRLFLENELDEILPQADHVILALPGSESTVAMLNSHRINLLANHAYVCNVGRGSAIEEMPLYAALSAGRIAGAFLDVFAEEPLPEQSILRDCPNLWRLPHASAIAGDYMDLYVDDFAQQWNEWAGIMPVDEREKDD